MASVGVTFSGCCAEFPIAHEASPRETINKIRVRGKAEHWSPCAVKISLGPRLTWEGGGRSGRWWGREAGNSPGRQVRGGDGTGRETGKQGVAFSFYVVYFCSAQGPCFTETSIGPRLLGRLGAASPDVAAESHVVQGLRQGEMEVFLSVRGGGSSFCGDRMIDGSYER